MTDVPPYQDIATLSRLEAATGPCRVLDFEVHIAIVSDPIWPSHDMKGRVTNPNSRMSDYLRSFRGVIDADDQDFDFPRFTASIDDALTLVPETAGGWDLYCTPSISWATVWNAERVRTEDQHQVKGKTPALALCTAALKARAALAKEPT